VDGGAQYPGQLDPKKMLQIILGFNFGPSANHAYMVTNQSIRFIQAATLQKPIN
jgi:hypothetical protein